MTVISYDEDKYGGAFEITVGGQAGAMAVIFG